MAWHRCPVTGLWRPHVPDRRHLVGVARAVITRQQAVAPAFTPADLPNLVHYWHAVNSSKTGSPGAISQLNDLIGTDHLLQATGANQPTDNTRTINGKVALDFDGSNDNLTAGSPPNISANTTMYKFIVAKVDTLVISDCLFHTGGFSATARGWHIRIDEDNTNGRLQLSWSDNTTMESYRPTTPVIGTSGPHLIEAWIIGTNGGVNLSIDGTDAAGATNTVGFGSLALGTGIFGRSGVTNALDGAWCEAGICSAVPDAGNRASLLAYAQSYWGTP